MAIASGDVVTEDLTGRRRQRHQTRLAELGAADRQHPILQIDILKLKIARFAEAQARNAQQPEQAVIDPRPQFTAALGLRSEEHTSELQSPCNLVCRLLLEKKKKSNTQSTYVRR